jgi:hypothetical protein
MIAAHDDAPGSWDGMHSRLVPEPDDLFMGV